MTAYLLDANVVIAIVVAEHADHRRALNWVAQVRSEGTSQFVCPTVQGAAVRYLIRLGVTAAEAQAVLVELTQHFPMVAEDMSYADVDLGHVRGHRQVTDAYLASLARRDGATLATFDTALAMDLPQAVSLIGAP